ncbi:hypothetical protein G7046_g1884 [Stylonectria norvegica]|nr:hypothetical protein G7046_g1884 [Stylonectria norvegica]
MLLQTTFTAATSALWSLLGLSALEDQGGLALVKSEPLFTLQYLTSKAASTNWIGLYHSAGGGPINEEYVSPSLVWTYAPDAQGTVRLSNYSLEPGTYTAFFLANGGYKWLADPIDITLADDPTVEVQFIATNVTLPNARQGDNFSQSIAGMVKGGGGSVTFSLGRPRPKWLSISDDGILSGTPNSKARNAYFSVDAIGSNNSTDTGSFIIRIRPSGSLLLEELQVLSLNMWHGGTQVNKYHEKQVRFIATSGADVVGLQEDQSGRHAPRLATALGWYHWASGGDTSILSKYPIIEDYGVISKPDHSGGVRIALDGQIQQVALFNSHLGYDPYGPYDFCFEKMTEAQVFDREAKSGRTPQMKEILAAMETQLSQADQLPVLFVGDFNAPSHLDWVEGLKEKNCGFWNISWPTSVLPHEQGLIDSFRVANPDPVKVEGLSWSPVSKWNDGWNLPEPQDRIDFIYHKGKGLKVLDSKSVLVGDPKPSPDFKENEWTSDHAAMLTRYSLLS